MAGKRKAPEAKAAKKEPVLEFDDGYWIIVDGSKRTNVGRSRRYAELMLDRYK